MAGDAGCTCFLEGQTALAREASRRPTARRIVKLAVHRKIEEEALALPTRTARRSHALNASAPAAIARREKAGTQLNAIGIVEDGLDTEATPVVRREAVPLHLVLLTLVPQLTKR